MTRIDLIIHSFIKKGHNKWCNILHNRMDHVVQRHPKRIHPFEFVVATLKISAIIPSGQMGKKYYILPSIPERSIQFHLIGF